MGQAGLPEHDPPVVGSLKRVLVAPAAARRRAGRIALQTLAEIDLADPQRFVDGTPHHWFARLRAEAPVYFHPEPDGPGFWCITKHEMRVRFSPEY